MKCSTNIDFSKGSPSLKESWKWLKNVLNEFMRCKQKLLKRRLKLKEQHRVESIVDKIKILFQMDEKLSIG